MINPPDKQILAPITEIYAWATAAVHNESSEHLWTREPTRLYTLPVPAPVASGRFLLIDVGGTATKAALVESSRTDPFWRRQTLFEVNNLSFATEICGHLPIERFVSNVAQLIRDRIGSPSLDGVALVWSNQAALDRFKESDCSGITGIISGMSEGSYQKGEWFLEGLSDGYDLGATFRTALQSIAIRPRVFIVGNDTAFVLTALPGANAGVVISTGANYTHSPDLRRSHLVDRCDLCGY